MVLSSRSVFEEFEVFERFEEFEVFEVFERFEEFEEFEESRKIGMSNTSFEKFVVINDPLANTLILSRSERVDNGRSERVDNLTKQKVKDFNLIPSKKKLQLISIC
ncbi:MAG: hypothetical protein PHT07_16340 [Paludibacter sp.]|nr:hypothetical protein [Paludibacter sp.]